MPRKHIVGGNWKMNTSREEAKTLAGALKDKIGGVTDTDVVLCPPFVYLTDVAEAIAGSNLQLGAQDVYFEDNGAFTGEISTAMLKDVCCQWAIIGHSERRHVIGETDETINKKVLKSLNDGLKVILAVGELLEQREAGTTKKVVESQVKVGLEGVEKAKMGDVVLAYEPVWAIGTGKTASPEQAEEVHAMIRALLGELYDGDVAEATRIQYGGSVKPNNAADLFAREDIDGGLIGGASLKPDDFTAIVNA